MYLYESLSRGLTLYKFLNAPKSIIKLYSSMSENHMQHLSSTTGSLLQRALRRYCEIGSCPNPVILPALMTPRASAKSHCKAERSHTTVLPRCHCIQFEDELVRIYNSPTVCVIGIHTNTSLLRVPAKLPPLFYTSNQNHV